MGLLVWSITLRSRSRSTLLALLMTSSASCTTLLQPSARMGGQPSLLGEETGEESGEEPEEEVYGSGDGDDYATVIYEDYENVYADYGDFKSIIDLINPQYGR